MGGFRSVTTNGAGKAALKGTQQDKQLPERTAQKTLKMVLNQLKRLLSRQQAEVGERNCIVYEANIPPHLK